MNINKLINAFHGLEIVYFVCSSSIYSDYYSEVWTQRSLVQDRVGANIL